MFEYYDEDIWVSFSHWGMFKTGEIRWTGRLVVSHWGMFKTGEIW